MEDPFLLTTLHRDNSRVPGTTVYRWKMTFLYIKALQRKKYFLVLVFLFALLIISSLKKTWRFSQSKGLSAKNGNSFQTFVLENKTKDPIDMFKSNLPPFKRIKNPCWREETTRPISQNMLKQMQMIWRGQIFSKEIPTPNMIEVMVNIRTEWYQRTLSKSKLRCIPYFYIMSSNNCIRNEILKILIQHPKIKAPDKIDIDFWPNILSDNIKSYSDHFDIPTSLIAEDNTKITFDASSSTFFKTNHLFYSKGSKYSTADFIHTFGKDLRFLVLLQDPVSKIYDDYLMKESKSSPKQFHEKVLQSIYMFQMCLKVSKLEECMFNKNFTKNYQVSLHLGIYWVFLERWSFNFSIKQLKLFCIEDYLKCKKCLMKHISGNLFPGGLPINDTNSINYNCLNPELPMLTKTKIMLKKFYSPFNEKLVKVSGKKDYRWH